MQMALSKFTTYRSPRGSFDIDKTNSFFLFQNMNSFF